jgi:hypothetical protein
MKYTRIIQEHIESNLFKNKVIIISGELMTKRKLILLKSIPGNCTPMNSNTIQNPM